MGLIPGIWEWVNGQKLINVICHLNRMRKKKKKQIISIDAIKERQSNNFLNELSWRSHTFWLQNLLQSYKNQNNGTGITADIQTNGTE